MLLSTDIIARGIDIDKVGLVINVFAPRTDTSKKDSPVDKRKYIDFIKENQTKSLYLHRVARTGRYVRKGVALTILRPFGRFKEPDSVLWD